jgi:signal transduction histidine kinase
MDEPVRAPDARVRLSEVAMRDARSSKPQAQDETAKTPQRRVRFGLAGRVLALIIAFVMLAEVAIYLPSIANFRNDWLGDRLSSAYTAALVFETGSDMVPENLKNALLKSVGAKVIVLKMRDSRHLLAVSDMPQHVDENYDLRNWTDWEAITAAFRTLTAGDGRILTVVGDAPMGAEYIEITLDETPLRHAMLQYSIDVLLLSLVISAIVAGVAAIAIYAMVLRPVGRLTSSLVDFGSDPEDASRIIQPSGRRDEIGLAEDALAVMQSALVRELNQKKHLAALGLAVAKINHDLRNMLSSAQLLSDRLSTLSDPLAQRLAPKLVATLDRAIAFCHSTLAYGRAAERPPKLASIALRQLVTDVAETISPSGGGRVEITNDVAETLELVADPEQMFRVLVNLCRNALEALESAGPQPGRSPLVTVSARRDESAVLIIVADTGPGLPDGARARLFEAFNGSTRPGGTGLGLAIAADLVRAHGGSITLAASGRDSGATFLISIPDHSQGASAA